MTRGKQYRSVETGESVGFYTLAFGSRHGAYSIERVDDGVLHVNGERFELVTGGTDGG